jgi:hypothetical protein
MMSYINAVPIIGVLAILLLLGIYIPSGLSALLHGAVRFLEVGT